jgi:hypothetical protein
MSTLVRNDRKICTSCGFFVEVHIEGDLCEICKFLTANNLWEEISE